MSNIFAAFIGERGGTRTHDLLIKSQLLYRLSYALCSEWLGALCRGGTVPGQ